jgi:putative addiction module component
MSAQFDEIQEQARRLPSSQKAELARILIEELDGSVDRDTEQLWLEEAQRRYDAYLKGEIEAIPGEVVMRRARERLK